MLTPQWWWMKDRYDGVEPVPEMFEGLAGPNGVALVRAWKDGKTDPGWGLRRPKDPETTGFMYKYKIGAFSEIPITFGFVKERWNFAFIMRSMKIVCIDIDGKNGGIAHVGKLGMLPITLAETSKSGDGYHLFYSTGEDVWDEEKGFALFSDRIALEQGVDFRATGCVYHYPQQRWNGRHIAELPDHLKKRLTDHSQKAAAQTAAIVKTLETEDQDQVIMMQDALVDDLNKPIPQGRRNTTLFAIGQQMKLAEILNWEEKLYNRALAVGLDTVEATKLVVNVRRYK